MSELMPRPGPVRARWRRAVAPLGAALLLATMLALSGSPGVASLPLRAGGLSLLLAGLLARRPTVTPAVARLLVASGLSMFLGDLTYSENPAVLAVGACLAYLYAGLIAHLALALPTGQLHGRLDRILVGLSYAACVGTQVACYLVDHAGRPWLEDGPRNSPLARASSLTYCVLASAVAARLAVRWARASRPLRRMTAALWIVLLLGTAFAVGSGITSLVDGSPELRLGLVGVAALAAATLPAAALVGLGRVLVARGRVARLIVELERDPDPRRLRDAMADVLGDPTLEVAYRLPDAPGWVDITGRPLPPPTCVSTDGHRHRTVVHRRGQDLAILTHDPALARQRPLLDAVLAAAGLALDNARLHASVQAQITQIRASRRRLSQAAFDERRRIQRDLHDGAQQQLLAGLVLLDSAHHALSRADTRCPATSLATELVTRAHRQTSTAVTQLRDLAQGIYPSILVERGLAAAVEALVDQAPLPVTARIPPDRWNRNIEVNAYFVIAEALTNVGKHAQATHAEVQVTVDGLDGSLCLIIADDGRGGARPGGGSGLRNLQDRVATVDGDVQMDSPAGAGTRVRVRLPLEKPYPPEKPYPLEKPCAS
ncbi:sensor histidine kinase [Frankia sp. R43]|uniref:sensor histidine kinase n=1 Tax=Frankia sp. R43 TaxID=269536 RepID=UPI0006CA23D3|nr:ATP-binding protein [Frankia sp. R43]